MKFNKSVMLAALCAVGAGLALPAFSATRLPFNSSFETGDFSEWNGGLDASMTVTGQQASAGRYSAQSVMTSGQSTDNYKEFVFGDHPRVNGTAVNASQGLWLQFDSKFDTGFRFPSTGNVHKIAIVNFEDSSSRRRYQILVNVWTANGDYFIEHLKWNEDRSFNRAMPSISQNVGTHAQVRYGQWDRLKLFIKPNTPGRADGTVQLWVNGELKANYPNLSVREDLSVNPNKMIMSNYVTQTTASGTQRWDNFYLGESDPGGGVRPNPPILNSVQ